MRTVHCQKRENGQEHSDDIETMADEMNVGEGELNDQRRGKPNPHLH
jgi:hypothetical protein